MRQLKSIFSIFLILFWFSNSALSQGHFDKDFNDNGNKEFKWLEIAIPDTLVNDLRFFNIELSSKIALVSTYNEFTKVKIFERADSINVLYFNGNKLMKIAGTWYMQLGDDWAKVVENEDDDDTQVLNEEEPDEDASFLGKEVKKDTISFFLPKKPKKKDYIQYYTEITKTAKATEEVEYFHSIDTKIERAVIPNQLKKKCVTVVKQKYDWGEEIAFQDVSNNHLGGVIVMRQCYNDICYSIVELRYTVRNGRIVWKSVKALQA